MDKKFIRLLTFHKSRFQLTDRVAAPCSLQEKGDRPTTKTMRHRRRCTETRNSATKSQRKAPVETKNNRPEAGCTKGNGKFFRNPDCAQMCWEWAMEQTSFSEPSPAKRKTCVRDLSRTTQNRETQRHGPERTEWSSAGRRSTS